MAMITEVKTKVYIIGSISKEVAIKCAATKFEKLGYEVRYVKQEEGYSMNIIRTCFLTIESWADLIVVIPKSVYPVLEIGEGTSYEMEHAKSFGKPVLIYYDI